jgi:hypothetical protein
MKFSQSHRTDRYITHLSSKWSISASYMILRFRGDWRWWPRWLSKRRWPDDDDNRDGPRNVGFLQTPDAADSPTKLHRISTLFHDFTQPTNYVIGLPVRWIENHGKWSLYLSLRDVFPLGCFEVKNPHFRWKQPLAEIFLSLWKIEWWRLE